MKERESTKRLQDKKRTMSGNEKQEEITRGAKQEADETIEGLDEVGSKNNEIRRR